jgi:hypothetical protein
MNNQSQTLYYETGTCNAMGQQTLQFVGMDHAGSADDHESICSYVLVLKGGAISWPSLKIKVVAE